MGEFEVGKFAGKVGGVVCIDDGVEDMSSVG